MSVSASNENTLEKPTRPTNFTGAIGLTPSQFNGINSAQKAVVSAEFAAQLEASQEAGKGFLHSSLKDRFQSWVSKLTGATEQQAAVQLAANTSQPAGEFAEKSAIPEEKSQKFQKLIGDNGSLRNTLQAIVNEAGELQKGASASASNTQASASARSSVSR